MADDNPLNQEMLRVLINQAGLTIDIVGDGAAALQLLQGRAPDDYALIMMDMHMPEMDGATASRAIRRLPGWAARPIVGITANVSPVERSAGLRAGMNDVIDKPVTPAALYPTLLRSTPSPAHLSGQFRGTGSRFRSAGATTGWPRAARKTHPREPCQIASDGIAPDLRGNQGSTRRHRFRTGSDCAHGNDSITAIAARNDWRQTTATIIVA